MSDTPYDEIVLGGNRAIDEAADALPEPVEEPRFTWHHLAFLGAVAFLLGVIVYELGIAP